MKTDNTILLQAAELLDFTPSSIEEAVEGLHSRLTDLEAGEYTLIDDLETLIEVTKTLSGTDAEEKLNPFNRTGAVIKTDEWIGISAFKKLRSIAEEEGWKVVEKRYYHNFIINGRVFFKLEGLRKTVGDNYSCRIVIPRVTDEEHLDLILNTYVLLEFKASKKWTILQDKKLKESTAHGRYFFLKEIEKFAQEIPNRI